MYAPSSSGRYHSDHFVAPVLVAEVLNSRSPIATMTGASCPCYFRLEASHTVNLRHSGSMEWADPTQTVAPDPTRKDRTSWLFPCYSCWQPCCFGRSSPNLIRTPILSILPASDPGGSPFEFYPENGEHLLQEKAARSGYDACPHRTGVLIALGIDRNRALSGSKLAPEHFGTSRTSKTGAAVLLSAKRNQNIRPCSAA